VSCEEVRFSVAGLEVVLRASGGGGLPPLSGFYDRYPSAGGAPQLVVDVEQVPGFADGRPRGARYPAFQMSMTASGGIGLSRTDAEGEIALPRSPDEPVRARFRIADSGHCLDAAVRVGASIALPRRGGLLLHASAVAAGDRALIFCGVSGAGKSTIASLLDDASPAIAKLADELLVVAPAPDAGGWRAHVTPFLCSRGLPHGASVPVDSLHMLSQAAQHRRTKLAPAAALRHLLRHVLVYVAEPDTADRVLASAARLVAEVPCHVLEFAKDPSVAAELGIP
jgi:hypothetical protein